MSDEPTPEGQLDVPVVMIVFNRPALTAMSFEAVRAVRPQELFLVADGPREAHEHDRDRCEEVRRIVEAVDWPCQVHREYAETNLGLKRRVETGLDWVFGQADRAIVLEDDCIAGPSFFQFCSELLERYADDERVMAVTGDNFQDGRQRGDASYYFSKYPHCWGWATWARAWAHYDGDYADWSVPGQAQTWLTIHPDAVERRYWLQQFAAGADGRISSWAFPWTDAVWRRQGLTATPEVNLVRNVGFGDDATNTSVSNGAPAAEAFSLDQPLRHPPVVVADAEADRYTFDTHFGGRHLRARRSPVGAARWIVSAGFRRLRTAFGVAAT